MEFPVLGLDLADLLAVYSAHSVRCEYGPHGCEQRAERNSARSLREEWTLTSSLFFEEVAYMLSTCQVQPPQLLNRY